MTLGSSPNHSVTKAQAPDRRVAAETEGNERQGEGHQNSAFPVNSPQSEDESSVHDPSDGTFLLGGKRASSSAFLCSTVAVPSDLCLCEAGGQKMKIKTRNIKKIKVRIWKNVIFSLLIRLKMKAFVSAFTWNFFAVVDNNRRRI